MKKVLFFFPHNPYPTKTGAHKRCMELLAGFRATGCSVYFASSTFTTDQTWTPQGISYLKENFVQNVFINTPGPINRALSEILKKVKIRLFGSLLKGESQRHFFMKRWFHLLIKKIDPHAIVLNYAYWDYMLDHEALKNVTTIIETHDLITLNHRMQNILSEKMGLDQLTSEMISDEVLEEDFFVRHKVSAAALEFEIYNKYDYTLCLSEKEAKIIQENSTATTACFLPMTHKPIFVKNTYSGSPAFILGPNLFNLQGFYYFSKKILPAVLSRELNFFLNVAGRLHSMPSTMPKGIKFLGFVENLEEFFKNTSFFICPVFGGTGQQMKIVEAMAYGLPVVALRFAADRSPIEHNVNGLVADSREEFVEHVLKLWHDRNLCKKLGQQAQETIVEEFRTKSLIQGLSLALNKTGTTKEKR